MKLLAELLSLTEADISTAAAAVYHRDYLRTKNKKYRKYHKKKTVSESTVVKGE